MLILKRGPQGNRPLPKNHDGQEHKYGRHQRLDHCHRHDIAISVAEQGVGIKVGDSVLLRLMTTVPS